MEASELTSPCADLDEADEVFLSGTAVEVTPVEQIDATSYEIGPVTRSLLSAYHRLVGRTAPTDA